MTSKHIPGLERDQPFLDTQSVLLGAGERAVLDYSLSDTRSQFHLVMAAISKHTESTYSIEVDGSDEYESPVPPTDIDNAQQTYIPPLVFDNSMTITVENLSDAERYYHCQIKGWERPPTVDEGGL